MKILPFRNSYQPMIDLMLKEIQAEFEYPFTSPASRKIIDANKVSGTRFWVVMDGNKLAGTVGMIKMKNRSVALKNLFVPFEYRGCGAALLLLNTVIQFSKKKKLKTLFLGTMDQMKAAQKFYTKNGFIQITLEQLPPDFPANILDTVFYKLEL